MPQTQIGIIGLGKMGSGFALQAARKEIEVTGFSKDFPKRALLEREGVHIRRSLKELVESLRAPRLVFLCVPAGAAVDALLEKLEPLLTQGDVIIDAGNSHFRDSAARASRMEARGFGFIDCGSSGGPVGALTGACLMVGGNPETVRKAEPVFRALSVPEGYLHVGPPGSGHFVKLIHNAIEFGMVQALGEGLALLKASDYKIDLIALFHNWAHGSVIRGWLVELMERQLREHPDLSQIPSYVEDTGEVNWALAEAIRLEVPTPVIAQSVFELFSSRDSARISNKGVAMLRHGFGGHPFGKDEGIARERRTGYARAPGLPKAG